MGSNKRKIFFSLLKIKIPKTKIKLKNIPSSKENNFSAPKMILISKAIR